MDVDFLRLVGVALIAQAQRQREGDGAAIFREAVVVNVLEGILRGRAQPISAVSGAEIQLGIKLIYRKFEDDVLALQVFL